jgi:NitT/TauT family transport system substrate-binding protein
MDGSRMAPAPRRKEKLMKHRQWYLFGGAVISSAGLAVAALAANRFPAQAAPAPTKVTLQLKWLTQAQFAGYYCAQAKGYYRDEGLEVTLKPGGPEINPAQEVASGKADFGVSWLSSLLELRDRGIDLVNIAQVMRRSGMTELTWKDSGITSIAQLRGKKVAVWLAGNEYELFAALLKHGLNPRDPSQVTIVPQRLDMEPFLQRKVDAAAAMSYNELAQVLETTNPATGKLYQLADLNVLTMEAAGTAMLQGGIVVRDDWLQSKHNQETARRFLKASFKGWIYSRDHPQEAVGIVLRYDPTLGRGHQTWQMNEINALIWPDPAGIGIMEPAAFRRTARIARNSGLIRKLPRGAYRTDLATAALRALKREGLDVYGRGWEKAVVAVTPGGR